MSLGCIAEGVHIKSSSNIIGSVNERYRAEPNVTVFVVRHQKVTKFPQELNTFFPNIKGVEIFNCSLKTIDQSDLKPLANLNELWLGNNDLEYLESDLFEFNPEIRILVFTKNKLKYIGDNILAPLPHLSKANFNKNKCIDAYAGTRLERKHLEKQLEKKCPRPRKDDLIEQAKDEREELLAKLQAAEAKLNLVEGNLAAATKHLLESSKKTYSRYIPGDFNNPVVELICKDGGSEICEAVDLKVSLPNTEIKSVARQSSESVVLGHITSLTIARQQILYLPANIGSYFTNLTHLTVTATGIFSIEPHSYQGFNHVVYFSLNRSLIHEVPIDAFLGFKSLKELDLSFNKISKIERRAFNGLNLLQKLRLNDNLLEAIQGNAFDSLRNLLSLSMANNRLQTVDVALFTPLTKLQFADFTGNNCISMNTNSSTLQEIAIRMRADCLI